MGLLIDGEWHERWYDTERSGGRFRREESSFRSWITADGSPGPSGEGGFPAESGRYHLYVSYACPWAHRTLIFRALKDLADHVSVSVVHPDMLSDGWTFDDGSELGNYNTQQHWVTHSDGLFLVYTRRGADNDDIARHRAPDACQETHSRSVGIESRTAITLEARRAATRSARHPGADLEAR